MPKKKYCPMSILHGETTLEIGQDFLDKHYMPHICRCLNQFLFPQLRRAVLLIRFLENFRSRALYLERGMIFKFYRMNILDNAQRLLFRFHIFVSDVLCKPLSPGLWILILRNHNPHSGSESQYRALWLIDDV